VEGCWRRRKERGVGRSGIRKIRFGKWKMTTRYGEVGEANRKGKK